MAASRLDPALKSLRALTDKTPALGLVLGSGLGEIAEQIIGETIPYSEIDGFPLSTAPTHKGVLHIGTLWGVPVAALQGRLHIYEGHTPQDVAFPIEVLHGLGVRDVILTNISGSLNPDYDVGDIIAIDDHIFLPGFAGLSPLIGRGEDNGRSRFVNLTRAYDVGLLDFADGSDLGALKRGTYACLAGPHFETPAEGRMLRQLGADMVGMSTVYETVMARYLKMRVLALSLIVNPVITDRDTQIEMSEAEIWDSITIARPRFQTLLNHVVSSLS